MPPAESESARWFSEEVQPHERVLRSYLRGAFPSVRDVDDVVQESFLRTWRVRAGQPIKSAKAFLFQVARRIAIDWVRREQNSPLDAGRESAALAVVIESPDALAVLTHEELRRHLAEAVGALPNRYREIVIMRRFEEIPQKEVARRLGLSERTVENLLARGIKKLETTLRDQGLLDRYQP